MFLNYVKLCEKSVELYETLFGTFTEISRQFHLPEISLLQGGYHLKINDRVTSYYKLQTPFYIYFKITS